MNASTCVWAHTNALCRARADAPVHSILAALYYSEDQIRIFDELGYEHNPCAKGEGAWARGKCGCDMRRSFGALLCFAWGTIADA